MCIRYFINPGLTITTLRKITLCIVALCAVLSLQAQADSTTSPSVYHIKKAIDLPLTGVAAAWTLYGIGRVSNKSHSTPEAVNALNKDDINWFDRWAVRPVSHSADKLSYIPFYAAMPLPLGLFWVDKKMRKDFFKLTLLYAEAMACTGVLYSGATMYADRYRPFVYTTESPMDMRVAGSARNSFFAGHVALVGTSTFFMAATYAAYHPNSSYKWVFYGGAATLTAATAYLRHKAGMHFPSDIVIGTAAGTLSGLLVPHFHKIKPGKTNYLSILPYSNSLSHGVIARWKL